MLEGEESGKERELGKEEEEEPSLL